MTLIEALLATLYLFLGSRLATIMHTKNPLRIWQQLVIAVFYGVLVPLAYGLHYGARWLLRSRYR